MSSATARGALSAECALGRRPGYEDLHGVCSRTRDVPLPYTPGILLVRRCTCACHKTAPASKGG